MRLKFINLLFIFIGVSIGIILALQIRIRPIGADSSLVGKFEAQKSILSTFTLEQEQLKKKLRSIQSKLEETKRAIEQRSSKKNQEVLFRLKSLVGGDVVMGEGLKITLDDSLTVSRADFSSVNENFVQASDLRDLVNNLFLQDAEAIAINGKRILPLTPIQPVFDSVLVGNFHVGSPFVVIAAGRPKALVEALNIFKGRKIKIHVETPSVLTVDPVESIRPVKFLSSKEL